MVRHQPLQYYKPQVLLSCIAGFLGCRWKRYQRSNDRSTKWERLWLAIIISASSFAVFWLYFWAEAGNDYDLFNWFIYQKLGYWYSWANLVLVLTGAVVFYLLALVVRPRKVGLLKCC